MIRLYFHTSILWLFTTLYLFLPCNTNAIGIVVPRIPGAAPPILVSAKVDVTIKDNIARSRITQVFKNANSRPVEADFYFPVPNGADITDFVLYMDGKPVKGEVLGKDEAHDIYRDIVRKMKDPGLVEWSEKNLFRVRIFPIPAHGEQKMEIELSQALAADQGYFRYHLPIDADRHPATPQGQPEISYTIRIEGESPIRNVYSPTHKIDTITSDPKAVTITANDGKDTILKDFSLFYESSDKNIALSLLTHKTSGADGFFSLRISPPWDESTTSAQPADYIFVIDSSGSMAEGDKMEQARKALRYCLGILRDNDRFNLIRFATTVETFDSILQSGVPDKKKQATEWVNNLEPRGGTNISEALTSALKFRSDHSSSNTEQRLFTVVFITDGQPTVGQTAPDAIAKAVFEQSAGNVRIFTFGVGDDVNTRLLDSLAERTRAASDYVAPGADLEVPVSRFFDKVSRPALYNLDLAIPNSNVTEMYPAELPDLFYGTELVVFGRYRKSGPTAINLSGTLAGEKKAYQFEKTFPESSVENAFVEKLWATRKVAWLLDQVRMVGESGELKKEIEELAKKYSIVTPYTSYLALEDKQSQPARLPSAERSSSNHPQAWQYSPASGTASQGDVYRTSNSDAKMAFKAESGAVAVETARELQQMKQAETVVTQMPTETRYLHGKTFKLENGVWKDSSITMLDTKTVNVKYLSDAWFQLIDNFTEIKDYLSLGEKVQVRMPNNSTLTISAVGIENIEFTHWKTLGLSVPGNK